MTFVDRQIKSSTLASVAIDSFDKITDSPSQDEEGINGL
jgi:hypothetical protein